MAVYARQSQISAPRELVFEWHQRPGAFQRLAPPWQNVELLKCEGIKDGTQSEFVLKVGPFHRRWLAEHYDYREGQEFCDVQIRGPFKKWRHTHTFETSDEQSCLLKDRIEYQLPLGLIGEVIAGRYTQSQLERAFSYRHRVTQNDLLVHQRYRRTNAMRILISGSSGVVGSAVIPFLTGGGHEVWRLVRKEADKDKREIYWNPATGELDKSQIEGFDAVVHLAGDNIAKGRWSGRKKQRIRNSRVDGTQLLCETLATLENPPQVVVSASAIGYYGDRAEEELTEESGIGTCFLSDVCQAWEDATEVAKKAGIRVVNLRFGVILTPAGGALAEMLFPFKMGVGGVVGNGRQYWSWITIDDVVAAIQHSLSTEELSGPVNAVGPNSATNREFTKVLGHVLRRPTIFPIPAVAARLVLGEMADELLLASANVKPSKLQSTGYEFLFHDLEGALRHVLGR